MDASLSHNAKVFILSYNKDDRIVPKRYLDHCELIEVDTNNELAMLKELKTLNSQISINAIIPGFEYYVPSSARLSAHFGLKGLPPETVDAMHYKHLMRYQLAKNNVRMPWFFVITSLSDIQKYKDVICFPCVIKPSHLAGSLYIIKVNNIEELESNLTRLFDDLFQDLGQKMCGDILIEEYISGKEFSIEGYVDNERINFVSITDKYLSDEPHFIEIGHIVRADITSEVEKDLLDYTRSVIKALNISVGPFHCEIRLSKKGPVLIEIAARLVGDCISELIELATGISLAELMITGYLGHPLKTAALSQPKQFSGVKFIYEKDKSGSIFSSIDGMEEVSKISGFHRFGLLIKPGNVICPFTDYRARIAELIFTGSTHEEVKTKLAFAESIIKVKSVGRT